MGVSNGYPTGKIDRRIAVAPMMDWTDRHCRYFLRGFSPRVLLYTEMITAEALLRGDAARLLQHEPEEQPLALQLGGSEPSRLASAARLGERAGYVEINLNCGCPSDRVHAGAFGACLMAEPQRVADCVAAMRAAVSIPVTVKMRIGIIDGAKGALMRERLATYNEQDYARLVEFTTAVTACRVRSIHCSCAPGRARRPFAQGKSRRAAAAAADRAPPEGAVPDAVHGGERWNSDRPAGP